MLDAPNLRLSVQNRLLSVLPDEEFDFLSSHLEPVSLPRGTAISQAGDDLNRCYFPNDGMISLLSVTEQGNTVEVGFTGHEGMLGFPVILGQMEMPYQALVQVTSECVGVDSKYVRELFDRGGVFHDVSLRYLYVIMRQIGQTCVCNHFHTIEARLCRWLTVMCERSNDNHLVLTQEFLAHMLGVQRTSIGLIANALQQNGIIRYSRGKVEILDAARLKQSACECYFVVYDEHQKFLTDKNFPVMSGTRQTA
jgi:CRP-like cAMP-binding protein